MPSPVKPATSSHANPVRVVRVATVPRVTALAARVPTVATDPRAVELAETTKPLLQQHQQRRLHQHQNQHNNFYKRRE